ncbi:hypothetical protein CU097_006425 [Rhizopus azygosporus]|uniref:Uncharacterized protein n=2 Tax=Rhizopus TaxID=4842 RepID=A0A367KAT4_RHIAZ|nr:hypothetical protein BCV71DRAFT_259970 [Rhizopus microsporus]RCH99325.1 hypothetical protein CU097_006425 [Rhizopus azygosporus]
MRRLGVTVTLARNESRSLVVIDKAPRKSMGSKGGILFKFQDQELASSEVGKNTVLPIDDRYLNGGLMKLPKTLRDMLSVFVRTNPSRISQFVSVGFLVMELNLELLVADVPVGSFITRISRTDKLKSLAH